MRSSVSYRILSRCWCRAELMLGVLPDGGGPGELCLIPRLAPLIIRLFHPPLLLGHLARWSPLQSSKQIPTRCCAERRFVPPLRKVARWSRLPSPNRRRHSAARVSALLLDGGLG